MANKGIVTIHGKDYMTVARRVELAYQEKALESIETEVINHNPIVVRARVVVRGRVFTGISSVNIASAKQIEKENPYEVSETSAVGRALGFAGFGLMESIASADEVIRAQSPATDAAQTIGIDEQEVACEVCGKPAVDRKGITKTGKPYHGIFCSTGDKTHTRWISN